jgi:hypothetical protein
MSKAQTGPMIKPEGPEPRPGERFQSTVGDPIFGQSTVKIADDFHGWLLAQASALRQQHYFLLDSEHLAEELEAMAARDRRELKGVSKTCCFICLSFSFNRTNYIGITVGEAPRERPANRSVTSLKIPRVFFRGDAKPVLASAYGRAREKAADDSGLAIDVFPVECPWSFDQIMERNFFRGVTRDS